MKKLSLLALAAMVSGVLFAQDAPKQSRNLGIYLDASSGQIAPNKDNKALANGRALAFEGNEMEWGLRYNQSFKAVPWLSMGGTLAFIMNFIPVHTTNGAFVGTATQVSASLNNIKSNVWISMPHFMLLVDARGLMGVYLNYGKSFGAGGSFSIGADLEYFYTGNPWYGNGRGDGELVQNTTGTGPATVPNYVIDYLGFWLSYNIGLGKGFSFSTTLNFRLNGSYYNSWASVEKDPAGSFELRWNNTFAYNVDGWGFFMQLRLSAYGLAGKSSTIQTAKDRGGAACVLQIISGLSYNFDFSK